jgi:hypothetical protein
MHLDPSGSLRSPIKNGHSRVLSLDDAPPRTSTGADQMADYFKISLEITIFWISEVPSPMVQSLLSR